MERGRASQLKVCAKKSISESNREVRGESCAVNRINIITIVQNIYANNSYWWRMRTLMVGNGIMVKKLFHVFNGELLFIYSCVGRIPVIQTRAWPAVFFIIRQRHLKFIQMAEYDWRNTCLNTDEVSPIDRVQLPLSVYIIPHIIIISEYSNKPPPGSLVHADKPNNFKINCGIFLQKNVRFKYNTTWVDSLYDRVPPYSSYHSLSWPIIMVVIYILRLQVRIHLYKGKHQTEVSWRRYYYYLNYVLWFSTF